MKIETRKGLWVSSSFTEKFGNEDITPAKTVPGFKTLERNMYDQEIKSELGVEECTLEDVAAFLENPPKGTNDGYWNIFYVAGCVVGVSWSSDSRGWGVFAWSLGDGRWDAGGRVFARNWHSDTLDSESGANSDPLTLPAEGGVLDVMNSRLNKIEAILAHYNLTDNS